MQRIPKNIRAASLKSEKYRDWQMPRRNPLPSGTIAVPQRCSPIFRPNSVAARFVFKGATGVRCRVFCLNASNGEVERQGEMRQGTSAWLWFHSLLFLADSMFSSLSKNIKIVCP